MKAQEILNKIKEVVGIELSEETAVQLEEMKLENGTIISAAKFESGESVFIKSEEEEIALPIGEYTLEDGRKLMVKEEGLIDSIGEGEKEEETEEVEASEDSVTETKEEEAEEVETELEEADKYVTKEEFALAFDEIKGMIEKLGSEKKEEMSEEAEKPVQTELSAEAAAPIVHNPEQKVETNLGKKIAPKREKTVLDSVFSRLNKNK